MSDDAPLASTFIRSDFIESIGTRSCNKEAVRKPSRRATRVTSGRKRRAGICGKGEEAAGTNGPGYIDTFVSAARRQIDAIARKRGLVASRGAKKSVGRARQK